MNEERTSILDMAMGAIKERVDYEMGHVLDNILDPNTDPTKNRKLTICGYLVRSGWTLEATVGAYEVLRARKPGYPRPLLVHNRTAGGCGYSIDERDMKVYAGRKKNRRKRGLPVDATAEERQKYWNGEGE